MPSWAGASQPGPRLNPSATNPASFERSTTVDVVDRSKLEGEGEEGADLGEAGTAGRLAEAEAAGRVDEGQAAEVDAGEGRPGGHDGAPGRRLVPLLHAGGRHAPRLDAHHGPGDRPLDVAGHPRRP